MMNAAFPALSILAAYLLGSISFAVVVSKLYRLDDPRTYGSKNPGATNVLRTGNKAAAALTLFGDAFKGWLAVFLAQHFGARYGLGDGSVALVAIGVFAGHIWPLYTKFAGGKGVATALGVLIGISPWLGLATLATWLTVAFLFRYSSLSALTAAVLAPMYYGLFFGVDAKMMAVALMSALLIWRHKSNISNLLAGKESRIGSKKK
ncbi:MAG: plsY [Burkholderiaceae bacterium]|nr:plsY [Burkholderiaceae bacterium]